MTSTSTQNPSGRMSIRRTSLRESTAFILFLVIAVLIEILVVLYAMSIGVKDPMPLQWSFTFPGTSSNVTLTLSPLFHFVPIAVITTLLANWAYLRKQAVFKPSEAQRGKPNIVSRGAKGRKEPFARRVKFAFLGRKKAAGPGREVRFRRTNMRSAIVIFVTFSALLCLISLFAYPTVIYQAISNAYESNPSLLNFIKGVGAAVAPIGAFLWPINNALLAVAPGFRNFVLSLGAIISPLANLDNPAKYLVFQNAAAGISAFIVLFYGRYARRGFLQARK